MTLGTPVSNTFAARSKPVGTTAYAGEPGANPGTQKTWSPPGLPTNLTPTGLLTYKPPAGNISHSQIQKINDTWDSTDPSALMNRWLNSQSALAGANFKSGMNYNALDSAADAAYYGNNAGYINSSYGNNMGLLGEERYRNVDLARGSNDEDRRYVTQTWSDLQRSLTNQRGTTDASQKIKNWLYGQNVGFNTRNRDLGYNQAALTRDNQWRSNTTDATNRGARSSRGFGLDQQAAANQYQQAYNTATLGYDQTGANLTAGHQQDFQSYRAALEQLDAARRTGQNNYTHGIFGIDQQGRIIDSMGRTYDIQGNQLGVDRDRSLNDNAHSQTSAENARSRDNAQLATQYMASVLAAGQQAYRATS